MSNPNYLAGRRFEYERKHHYQKLGYTVIRASGSHGPYDLVCIRRGFPVLCIQCKRVTAESEARRIILDFKTNPPIKDHRDSKFLQRIEVKIKSDRIVDGTI